MTKFEKVRMGMVGGGKGAFIGAVHRMAAALDGKVDLVCGAFSQEFDNTKETGSELGLNESRLYASFTDMLDAEVKLPENIRMEVVSIVTPNHLHVPMATAAMERGFHVICDKPVGISLQEALDLQKTINETGQLFALTHTYAGYPMAWQAQHLVSTNKLGKIRKIHVEYPQGWLASDVENSGSKQASWRTDPSKSGISGCMGDIGTHAHHLAEFIAQSAFTKLSARLNTHIDGRALEDDGAVIFEMENGTTGTLIASQVCAGEENALKIRVYGTEGSLEWAQMEPNSLLEKSNAGVFVHRAGIDKPLCENALQKCRLPAGHPEGYLEAFANIYKDFALKVRGEETAPIPGINEGIRGMAFLETLVKSHENAGAWTDMPALPILEKSGQ